MPCTDASTARAGTYYASPNQSTRVCKRPGARWRWRVRGAARSYADDRQRADDGDLADVAADGSRQASQVPEPHPTRITQPPPNVSATAPGPCPSRSLPHVAACVFFARCSIRRDAESDDGCACASSGRATEEHNREAETQREPGHAADHRAHRAADTRRRSSCRFGRESAIQSRMQLAAMRAMGRRAPWTRVNSPEKRRPHTAHSRISDVSKRRKKKRRYAALTCDV